MAVRLIVDSRCDFLESTNSRWLTQGCSSQDAVELQKPVGSLDENEKVGGGGGGGTGE